MAKGKRDSGRGARDRTDWSAERTLADVEAEARDRSQAGASGAPDEWNEEATVEMAALDSALPFADAQATRPGLKLPTGSTARCACGGEEFVLEAYFAVVRGQPQPVPLELEALTCPQCGREYEAIWLDGGLVARGDYRGKTDLD